MLSAVAALLPLTAGLALQVRVQVGTPPADSAERQRASQQDSVRSDSTRRRGRDHDHDMEIRKIPVTARTPRC